MDWSQREKWIDKVIREAQERGFFENLVGEGRSINWEDEALVDDEWVMAFRLMREHGVAPAWIELNKKIADFNLKVPIARLQKFILSVDEELVTLEVKTDDL